MVEKMTKKFQAAKVSILTGLVLISTIVALVPTTSAGPLFNLQSVINVTWGNETQQPIVPRGQLRQLDLIITHTVTRGALGKLLLQLYQNTQIIIDLQITDSSSWCTATLSQSTLSTVVMPDTINTVKTKLSLQVADDAPAFELGYVKIKATVQKIAVIKGFEQEFTLSFQPDYKPLIKPTLPETNTKQIGPLDTATFPINIENLGNARTVVNLKIVDVPKGWVAIVTSQITLEEGSGSIGTAYLVIKPPKGFGYHDDQQTITISMQPAQADRPSNVGVITYEQVLVQSRGFSTPGFEGIGFIGALAIVMITMYILRKRQ
jgi:hypothetical protein